MNPTLAFRDPWWLLALLLVPAVLWLRRRRPVPIFVVPSAAAWHRPGLISRGAWRLGCALGGLTLLALALARPQRERRWDAGVEGYDIMLVIDLSESMLKEDYRRNGEPISRFEAIKPVIRAFIERRPNDRVGVVVFSGQPYTLAPPTFDHAWLARQMDRLKVGMIAPGTAIGDGVAVAVRRLDQAGRTGGGRRTGAFVVLLTDGDNNSGLFTPLEAAKLAQEHGVPVYAVAAGAVDEKILWLMAVNTGGRFYRAHDAGMIRDALWSIDRAQSRGPTLRRQVQREELFPWLAVPGAVLFGAAALLTRLPWRRPALA